MSKISWQSRTIILGIILGIVALVTITEITSNFSTPATTSQVNGIAPSAANKVILLAGLGCLDHPLARLLGRNLQIVAVHLEPSGAYQADVRMHTFLGIPTGMIHVHHKANGSDEVVCGESD